MIPTNLPADNLTTQDSATKTRLYFNSYGQTPESYNSNDITAAIDFFVKRNFTEDAAMTVAMTILQQAKRDQVPVFEILESIANFDNVQINFLVASILNDSRRPTSAVGFNTDVTQSIYTRNIIP